MLSESPSSSLPPLVLSRPRCDFASRDFRRKSPDWTMAGARPSPRAPLSRRREARQCGRLTQRESPFSLLRGEATRLKEEVFATHSPQTFPELWRGEPPRLAPPSLRLRRTPTHIAFRRHETASYTIQVRPGPPTPNTSPPASPPTVLGRRAAGHHPQRCRSPCCRVWRPCARRRRLGHLFRLALGRQKTPHTRHVSLCSVADPVTDRLASRPRAQISHPYHNVERQPSHPWLRQPAP